MTDAKRVQGTYRIDTPGGFARVGLTPAQRSGLKSRLQNDNKGAKLGDLAVVSTTHKRGFYVDVTVSAPVEEKTKE